MSIRLISSYVAPFVTDRELDAIKPEVAAAHALLHGKNGPGNAFLGWLDLPRDYDKAEYARIKAAATFLSSSASAGPISVRVRLLNF